MEHQSSLSSIDEDDKDPRGRSAPYKDLPMVTSKVRTLTDTTQRQNAESAILRKQLMAIKEKEDRLNDRIQELEELTAALASPTGRNTTDKTANSVQPSGLNSAGPSTPRRCVPSRPKTKAGRTNREGHKHSG
jgi:hypothetical protein